MISLASKVLGLAMTDDYEFLFRSKIEQEFSGSQTGGEMPFSTWADSERG
jgi:hypothetical protein